MKTSREGWRGFAKLGAINAAVFGVLMLGASSGPLQPVLLFPALLYGGLIWAWSGPLIGRARRGGRPEYANGMLAAAALTSLASGACWVWGLATFRVG